MVYTKRLYDDDSYLKEWEAKVISEQIRGYDGLYELVLDQTAFYPTGGGQPHDTGWINDVAVLDVYKMDGVIYHVMEKSLNGTETVFARLDWQRRFDHMQQHTGQHILSRVFEVILNAETIGFHLGEEIVTIDLELENLSNKMIEEVENLANRIIVENRKIVKKEVKSEKLSEELKRKIPDLGKYVRIVEINDFDYCACSGTHHDTTAEVGIIKILSWEKYKQNIRLSFVCGNRGLGTFAKFQDELFKSASVLKTNWMDVARTVNRLIAEKEEAEKSLKELKIKHIGYEIEEFKKKTTYNGEFYYLEKIYENREFNEIKQLADGITKSDSYVVFFINKTTDKAQFYLQRSDNLKISMNQCLIEGLKIIEGKGGGNPKVAQGGGTQIEKVDEAIEKIRDFILKSAD